VSADAGRILLVGAGNMGGAMLRGWIGAGVDRTSVTVVDPGTPVLPDGLVAGAVVPEGAVVDTLVLAIKPQQLREEAAGPLGQVRPQRLVSVLAGVETETLAAIWPGAAVVRAMPNLPVAIGRGVVALYARERDAVAEVLMAPLGLVEWIADEALFDAVTALSGCGPGFVFRFADALTQAGVVLGLPADQAGRLARATLAGSAIMAASAEESPATLADRVASPGGSTREGLNVLDRDAALVRLMTETLAAAARRNAELAAAAR
jgi:pyrroline-5-carboxylate reductase